jgi:hypothetical protein
VVDVKDRRLTELSQSAIETLIGITPAHH